MANRFFNPNEQFGDATGTPYAGGSLTFYASGTTTPLNTYSNQALSIANTNPVVLDSAGRAGTVFLQNLAYKVVLADANSNVIWTMDPVFASDYSTTAQLLSGNGSPNGNTAGSAGSPTIPASVYWDATNLILYVCTQTGTSSTAVWTAINSSSAANVIVPPQGYLTLTSQTPILTSDVTAATSVFYTPYVGNLIPIYNGTSFTQTVFSELSCALVSSHAANAIYDFFVFNNSGVLTLATGPAWTNSGAATSARGTGAGTTQLSRVNGLWVNTVSMTGRNGSTTYTIPANQGTYVGSIFMDASNGQTSCYVTYGQLRKWGLWNCYNREPIVLQVGDGTSSWNVTSSSLTLQNGTSSNSATVFVGLQEENCDMVFSYRASSTFATSGVFAIQNGMGYNSTSSATGFFGFYQFQTSATGSETIAAQTHARHNTKPTIGINKVNMLEACNGAVTNVAVGGNGSNLMLLSWRG